MNRHFLLQYAEQMFKTLEMVDKIEAVGPKGLIVNVARGSLIGEDALMLVATRITTFGGRSRFTTWLYRLVINLGRDELRRRVGAQLQESELPEKLKSYRLPSPKMHV